MNDAALSDLYAVISPVIDPALAGLDAALPQFALADAECRAVRTGLVESLRVEVLDKSVRVLLLELHAARAAEILVGADSAARWDEWVAGAVRPDFWGGLTKRYPTLLGRLTTVAEHRCAAALKLAERFAADRAALAELVPAGARLELTSVTFGAGDSHHGGQTVVVVTFGDAKVLYKPRPLEPDRALDDLLANLLSDEPAESRIRVPAVLCRDGYGWAEWVGHRYCVDDTELRAFYRGIGRWLAFTRLLSATDLHAENLIAAGPVPIVVDCETLFTPQQPRPPSGYGEAADRAAALLRGSVLRTGLLPGRSGRLGYRGSDVSGMGALPGEQPGTTVTVLLDLGTDQARLGQETVPAEELGNQPSAQPALIGHRQHILDAFAELTERLTKLDQAGALEPMLAEFRDCPMRIVLRDTVIYAELMTMLWHPASLHDEPGARARAERLLAGHAKNTAGAPAEPAAIAAEVDELLVGDVPFHTATGGPDGVTAALDHWRGLDPMIDLQVIECAVQSAYLDDESTDTQSLIPSRLDRTDLDRRRRTLAASLIRLTADRAIRGEDGTVAWTAPTFGATGIVVQPLGLDLYGGLPGVAVLLAGYRREVDAGRADPVAGLDSLLADTVHTVTVMEDAAATARVERPGGRPEAPGAYVGLASRIWSWSLLGDLGAVEPAYAVGRSRELAALLGEAVAADEFHDVLIGRAGAVVPLLWLAEVTGEPRWRAQAVAIGDQLVELARVGEDGARWPGTRSAEGIGGFAHGAAGIGWALARLATATGERRFAELADSAFAFQESLRTEQGWTDLRKPGTTAQNWCHGSDGVGVLAADLDDGVDPRWGELLRHAAAATWRGGLGSTHTLCHGDLGSWEVLELASAAGVAPAGVTPELVDAHVLSSLEEFGFRAAMTQRMFRPGLLSGLGGVAYQLLRLDRGSDLPSLLVPDPQGRRGC